MRRARASGVQILPQLIAAAHLALAAAGCGYAVPAAIVAAGSGGGGGGGGGGTVGGGFTAEISDVPRASAAPDVQPVVVRLVDANGESAALRLEFRDDGAGATAFAPATLARVRQGGPTGAIVAEGPFATTPFLASAPAGAVYFFEWLWPGDVGPTPRTNVALQLVVVQTAGGLGSGVAFTTTGRKVGNEPPALSAVEVVGQSGVVVVRFAVQDSSADGCNIEATFRADSDPARALAAMDPGALSGIAAPLAPPPLGVDFLWDTAAANQVGARRSSVVVELVAVDEAGARSAPVAAPAVTIENDTPPRALVTPVPRATSGTATILYSLVDAESQPTDVEVTFESEDGLRSGIATAAGGDGIAGLATAPSGAAHFFVWDYAGDVSETADRIFLTIRPTAASGVAGTVLISVGNSAPVATFQPPPPADLTGLATIDFAVADASGDLVQAILEFSTDGGQSFLAVATDSQTIGLAPGPRSIVWRTADDLPLADGVPVVLRLRASDGLPGGDGPVVTAPTRVDNVGNRPPVATIAPPARTPAGDVTVPFTATDPDGDPVTRLFEYVVDGGGGPVAASAGPGGDATTFVWDADGQLGPGPLRVKMRLTPSDVTLTGAPVESGFFFVGNSAPAAAFTSAFPGTSRGAIEVPFTLEDGQGDPAAVALSFSTNGGASFQTAVTAGATIALSSGGAGAPAPHTIFWKSDVDLPGAAATPVVLRLSADDGFPLGAGAAVTVAAVVENAFGRPPSALVFDVPRTATGLATIPYALFDLEGDPISVAIHFSLDGTSFTTALPGPGGDGLTGLSASGDGDPHTFIWDYGTQIGLAARSGVIVRVTPSDAGGPGAFGLSPPCRIGNEPPAFAGAPPEGIGGPERPVIRFTLADASSDLCAVVPSFSFEGSSVFTPITAADVVAGATAGLAATPAGRTFDFAWNAAAQIGNPPQQVVVRLVPSDPFATGPEALTATFTAGAASAAANRPPSVAVTTPDRSTTGKLAVFYELFDAESDGLDVLIEFSTNGGASFVPALESTDPADASEGTTGLFGLPGGFTFRFVWDFGTQVGFGGRPDVRIRITPSDPLNLNTGAPATSAPFLLGNDPPEVVGPLEVTGSALTPTIRFALRDSTADATSVRLRWSLEGGPTTPIAPSFLVSGTIEGLAAPLAPGGLQHEVVWNAAAQVGAGGSVVVDVVPIDAFGPEGATVTAAPFTLAAPGTLTVTAIRPAEGPASGDTDVEIDGAGFVDGITTVRIDGVPAPGVLVLSGNLIAARTPPGLLGARDVVVEVGPTPLTLTAGFTYRPSIAFKAATGFVPEGGGLAPIEIVLTGDGVTPLPPGGVLVTVATGLGSATLDRDYTGPAQTQIGFTGSGAGPRTVTLNAYTIVPDGFREPDETLRIELRSPALAILDAPSVRSLTILDDDAQAFAFDALPARPHVTEMTSLSWFIDAAAAATSFDLAPGGTSVGAIDSSVETPFPVAPAAVDPRAGYRVSQLRPNGFDTAEIDGLRQVGATGNDTGLAVAAMPDGGAALGGSYAANTQPVLGQGEPGAVTLPLIPTSLRLYVARYREDQSLQWATAISGTATVAPPTLTFAGYPDGGIVAAGSFRSSVRFFDAGALGGPATSVTTPAVNVDAGFVVRYRPDGKVAWARSATGAAGTTSGDDRAQAVAACLDGGAIVAGAFQSSITFAPGVSLPDAPGGTFDAFIARYRADGSVAWARRGSGPFEDRFFDVAATPDGGAIGVGRFDTACTFSEAGEPLVQVDGGQFIDAFVVRFGPDGRPMWARKITGAGPGESANAVAALPDGSCFVGGVFGAGIVDFGDSITLSSGLGVNDGFLARYDAAGDIQWARVFRCGTATSIGTVLGVVALADGSVATCGIVDDTIVLEAAGQPNLTLTSGGATGDGFIARHDGDGRVCWAVRAGSAGGETEVFNAIAGLPDGRVVAAGTFRSTTGLPVVFGPGEPGETQLFTPNSGGSPHPTDGFLVRYRPHSYTMLELRPTGAAWATVVSGTAGAEVKDVAGSHDGDVVLGGKFLGSIDLGSGGSFVSGGGSDGIVARLGPDGALRWASPIEGGSYSDVRGAASFLDGTTIAAGTFEGTITFGRPVDSFRPTLAAADIDAWVAKYEPDGDVIWRLGLGAPGDEGVAGVSAAGDGGGIVAIQGVTLAARVSGAGSLLWTVESGGSGAVTSLGVAAFPDGGAVVVGFFSGQPVFGAGLVSATMPAQPAQGGEDGFALRLDAQGQVVWLSTLGGPGSETASDVAVFPDGSAIVVGDFPDRVVRLTAGGALELASPISSGGGVNVSSSAALPDGGAAIAGTFSGGATFPGGASLPGSGAFVLRLARDGSTLWVKRAGGTGSISVPVVAGQTDRCVILGGVLTGAVTLGEDEPNAQPLDTGLATQGFVGKFYPYE